MWRSQVEKRHGRRSTTRRQAVEASFAVALEGDVGDIHDEPKEAPRAERLKLPISGY
jgi:hypothetical protein